MWAEPLSSAFYMPGCVAQTEPGPYDQHEALLAPELPHTLSATVQAWQTPSGLAGNAAVSGLQDRHLAAPDDWPTFPILPYLSGYVEDPSEKIQICSNLLMCLGVAMVVGIVRTAQEDKCHC